MLYSVHCTVNLLSSYSYCTVYMQYIDLLATLQPGLGIRSSLKLKSDRERFPQVAHDKRAIVRELLRWLFC